MRQRKKKLAQLYCLSNFPYSSVKESQTSDISKYIVSFLDKNDIEKGIFNESTLLEDKESLKELSNGGTVETEADEVVPVNKQPEVTKEIADDASENNSEKITLGNDGLEIGESNKRKLEQSSTQDKKIRKLNKPVPIQESSFELAKINQNNQLIEKQKKSVKQEPEMTKEDSIYMLLKENLPTKIIKTMPLAKLFYYSKSLQMVKLLANSHKVLTTGIFESLFLEGKISVVHSRIEELQKHGKWCLKQPRRHIDPIKQLAQKDPNHVTTHWDSLLQEGCWMSTDFREARKFNLSMCLFLANEVMEYHKHGKEVCITPKEIRFLTDEEIEERNNQAEEVFEDSSEKLEVEVEEEKEEEKKEGDEDDLLDIPSEPFADFPEFGEDIKDESDALIPEPPVIQPSATIDVALLTADVPQESLAMSKTPEEMDNALEVKLTTKFDNFPFKLYLYDDSLDGIDKSIVENLPAYTPFDDDMNAFESGLGNPKIPGSEFNDTPIVAISKLLLPFENDQGWYKVVQKVKKHEEKADINFEGKKKGLFVDSNSRRHHPIRPPPPPPLKFIDLRTPTIWLPQDDAFLIKYAEEFSYNWNVISAHLGSKATKSYTSNIERRTPWQCFERYIQLTEKFQFSDMRGPNAQAAQVWLEAAHRAQTTTKRRISPLGVGKESIQRGHTRLRWASMFEAMRKTMKKRENAPKPSNPSSFKRQQLSAEEKLKILSPAELSQMKYDRERAARDVYVHNMSQTRKNGSQSGKSDETNSGDSTRIKSLSSPAGSVAASGSSSAVPVGSDRLGDGSGDGFNINRQLLEQQRQHLQLQSQSPSQLHSPVSSVTPVPGMVASQNTQQYVSAQLQKLMQLNQKNQAQNQKQNSGLQNGADLADITKAGASVLLTGLVGAVEGNSSRSPIHMQVSAFINKIQAQNPSWSNEEVTRAAARHFVSIQNQIRQRNSSLATSASKAPMSTSPVQTSSGTQVNNPSNVAGAQVNSPSFTNSKQPIGKTINMSKNMISQSLMGKATATVNPSNGVVSPATAGAGTVPGLQGLRINLNSLTPQQKNQLMLQVLQRQQQQQQQLQQRNQAKGQGGDANFDQVLSKQKPNNDKRQL